MRAWPGRALQPFLRRSSWRACSCRKPAWWPGGWSSSWRRSWRGGRFGRALAGQFRLGGAALGRRDFFGLVFLVVVAFAGLGQAAAAGAAELDAHRLVAPDLFQVVVLAQLGCMMWTTASPQSTSTHSPTSSPSTAITWPPASLTASRTEAASALVWRLEVPLAMTVRSNSSVRWVVLKTLMSCALTSSSASTITRCSLRISILSKKNVGAGKKAVKNRIKH